MSGLCRNSEQIDSIVANSAGDGSQTYSAERSGSLDLPGIVMIKVVLDAGWQCQAHARSTRNPEKELRGQGTS